MIFNYKVKIKTSNFIRKYINYNIKNFNNLINTRFPPEAGGYLHIGHIKSILLNMEISKIYNGLFLLRIDDTNPKKNKNKYKKFITKLILWIKKIKVYCNKKTFFASNYFYKLYQYLENLIKKKYSLNKTKLKLKKIRNIRLGFYKEKKFIIKIKKNTSSFMNLYRILYNCHFRTKYYWFIYPLYDYSNIICDKIENIKYSLCTLEFKINRLFYNWIKKKIYKNIKPIQLEFSKLRLKNSISSKRLILKLKKEKYIKNSKDERLLTVYALKKKGLDQKNFLLFYKKISISKNIKYINKKFLINSLYYNNKKFESFFIISKVILIIKNFQKNKLKKIFFKNNSYILSKSLIIDKNLFKNNKKKSFKIKKKKKYNLKNTNYIIIFTNYLKNQSKIILFCNLFLKKKKNYKEISWLNQFYKNKISVNINENILKFNNLKKKKIKLNFNFKSKKYFIIYNLESLNIKKKYQLKCFEFPGLGVFIKVDINNKFINNKYFYISKNSLP